MFLTFHLGDSQVWNFENYKKVFASSQFFTFINLIFIAVCSVLVISVFPQLLLMRLLVWEFKRK